MTIPFKFPPSHVGSFQFKFSTGLDKFLIIFGLLVAFSMGVSMPILCILFGDTLQVSTCTLQSVDNLFIRFGSKPDVVMLSVRCLIKTSKFCKVKSMFI